MAAIPNVTKISISLGADIFAFGSSDTAGWKTRVPGPIDNSAVVTAKCDDGAPIATKGSTGTFLVTETGQSKTISFAAYCESVNVNVDINTGAPVEYVYTFLSTGAATVTASGSTILLGKLCTTVSF